MRELHSAVTRILDGRREAGGAKRLWERIWKAYEDGSGEGVREVIRSMTDLPDLEEGFDEEDHEEEAIDA